MFNAANEPTGSSFFTYAFGLNGIVDTEQELMAILLVEFLQVT